MADVYIVYAHEDRTVAEKLHTLLAPRWDTWWDDKITGRFAKAIETEMPKARCVVPLFSASSREKDTFTDELRLGRKHQIEFLPVLLDDSDPPYPYGSYSYTEMRGWNGEADHPGFLKLQRRLATIVPPRAKPQRPAAVAKANIPLPTLFLSVSSHETQLVPPDAVRALRVFGAPTILVSAYDLVNRRKPQALIEELTEYRASGGFVLVDSGNYEASRLGSRRWKVNDLEEALAQTPHDWAFCFDVMNPLHHPDRAIDQIIRAVERDSAFTNASVLPVVHAPICRQGGYKLDHIPRIIREVANRLEPQLIAIPERELGPGIIARAKTIRAIREELSNLPFYQPLHVLGTGNPWSMAILAAAGADSFDGLEWCRMAVDRDKDRLHHFQHFDFFTYQTAVADSPITRDALKDPAIDFAGKVAFHNLDYFASLVKSMREAVSEGSIEALVVGLAGKDTANQLKKHVPGLFK
jgi:queuine/archaeosine tRNA-ribosyltransferase